MTKLARQLKWWSVLILFPQLALAQSDPPDIVALRKELQQKITQVDSRTKTLVRCDPTQTDCQIRLWVAQTFLSETISQLLNNQSFQYQFAGLQNGPNLDSGGGALGCGWYAEVTGLSASLQLSTVSPQWLDNPIRLSLAPAFHFSAAAQVAGHVKGPAGPCSLFRWSCDCPLGGGFGTSVGVTTDAVDQLNYLVTLVPSNEKLEVQIAQADKTIRLDLWVGLGQFGQVRFPVDVPIHAQNPMYSTDVPLLFGTSGYIQLPDGTQKNYQLSVVQPSVTSDDQGIALLFNVQLVWE